jgi:hypothetical protein
MTTLQEAASLSSDEQGLVVVSTLRANGTIQSSLVNAGVLAHPVTGEAILAVVAAGPVKLANLRARPRSLVLVATQHPTPSSESDAAALRLPHLRSTPAGPRTPPDTDGRDPA